MQQNSAVVDSIQFENIMLQQLTKWFTAYVWCLHFNHFYTQVCWWHRNSLAKIIKQITQCSIQRKVIPLWIIFDMLVFYGKRYVSQISWLYDKATTR